MGHITLKKGFTAYLKFKCNCAPCILSGNSTGFLLQKHFIKRTKGVPGTESHSLRVYNLLLGVLLAVPQNPEASGLVQGL